MLTQPFIVVTLLVLVTASPGRADRETSRAHFERGTAAYKVGDFSTAAEAYEAAYGAEPLPQLLFNAGQAHHEAGNTERALFFYERYIQELPDAPNLVLVRQRIAEAKERGAARQEQVRLKAEQERARLELLKAEQDRQRAEENRRQAQEERKRAEAVSKAAQTKEAARAARFPWLPTVSTAGALALGLAVVTAVVAGGFTTLWVIRTRDTLPATDLGS